MKVFVNGYGTVGNENYRHYLSAVCDFLKQRAEEEVHLYLGGGHTDSDERTEAAAMEAMLVELGVPTHVQIFHLEGDMTRENLEAFSVVVAGDEPVIFCEYSRQPTVRFFAHKLFGNSRVVHGVDFDPASMRWKHRLVQSTLKLWLEKLAWHTKLFDHIRLSRRRTHKVKVRGKIKKQGS